ncbi:MAG: hypothetical protein IPK99_12930 [Flavobacteriales bacterium]|nr:hypothetical protein [Flavobacteriales bacterium]
MNRRDYSGTSLLSSGQWSSAVDAVLQLPAPVNIGIMCDFDTGTRGMLVTVDLYYTANSPAGNDRMLAYDRRPYHRLADGLWLWRQPAELRSSPCIARVPDNAGG